MTAEDRYRLAPLRDARAIDEKVKRGDLASAVGDARAAEAALAELATRVDAAREAVAAAVRAFASLADAGSTPARLALADRYLARRRRDLDAAIGEHDRGATALDTRHDAVAAARGRLAAARTQRQVIERHFADWRSRRRKLAERRED